MLIASSLVRLSGVLSYVAKGVPGIEVVNLSSSELDTLVRKTRILINTVGPYHLYSTPVVEACARNGIHYVDVTGESPWVLDMIKKYDETAKSNGAIIIPQVGFESSPSDLLIWALAREIRERFGTGTRDVIGSLHEVKGKPSGGTLATILSTMDKYTLTQIRDAASGNWSTSPVKRTPPEYPIPLSSRLFGVRTIPHLGIVTTSLNAPPNVATVQRTWGLLDGGKYYGPNFQYHEYMTVPNFFVGAAFHLALTVGALALVLSPVRWLFKKFIYAPGQGPTKDAALKDSLEFRAIATADQDVGKPRQALGRVRYDGSIYGLTGVFMAEAAMVLLEDEHLERRLGGGLLTPSSLGQHFIDRMVRAGLILETQILVE